MTVSLPRLFCLLTLYAVQALAADPSEYAIPVTATVQVAPPQIQLTWSLDSQAGGYSILRKLPGDTTWSGQVDLVAGTTTWTDSAVTVGTSYEYALHHGSYANGYIASGIEVPVVDARGAVVLLVDAAQTADLASELTRLVNDLRGDGWQVLRHDVAVGSAPPAVKALILADSTAAPGQVKEVLIVGHVAVPYSGQLNPDGHPEHQGAWPADTYYADLAGSWTDTSVNTTSATRDENDNIPGDGKFDQSYIPSGSALVGVGRVDFANMPAFGSTETAMLRRYLDRDHAWRTGQVTVQRKALIDDNFGEFGSEAFSQSGWRLTPLVGAGNVANQDWFGILRTNSYLFAYGCGAGWYTHADGVGQTADFASGPSNAVFTMLFGSYFGDWDAQDGFLRAPLAGTGLGLTCCWAGRPGVALHRMGMGISIGEAMVANLTGITYTPTNYGGGLVHQALMGDPTLRLHPMIPPGGLTANAGSGSVSLAWSASADAGLGYHVYRARGGSTFTRVTNSPLTATAYIDNGLAVGSYTYQVRAIRRETSPSGTYLNNSQGALANVEVVVGSSPTVTSLSVISGPTTGGTATTITGTFLTGATAVTCGGVAATSVVVVDATTITCVTPAGTVGAAAVAVTTPSGTGTKSAGFTYVDSSSSTSVGSGTSTGNSGGSSGGPLADGRGGNGGCGAGGGIALMGLLLSFYRRRSSERPH